MDKSLDKSLDKSNKQYQLSILLFQFCLDELEKYRKLISDNDIYTNTKIESSKIIIQYIKTAENLCKLVEPAYYHCRA
jgi:hypothetical protein